MDNEEELLTHALFILIIDIYALKIEYLVVGLIENIGYDQLI